MGDATRELVGGMGGGCYRGTRDGVGEMGGGCYKGTRELSHLSHVMAAIGTPIT